MDLRRSPSIYEATGGKERAQGYRARVSPGRGVARCPVFAGCGAMGSDRRAGSTLALTIPPDTQEIPMSLSLIEVAALRRLARVYRRIFVLAVPAALAGCQDSDDPLAPDAAGAVGEVAAPAAEAVANLNTAGRIAFSTLGSDEEDDVWTMNSTGGAMKHLTSFTGAERNPVWSPDHQRIAFQRARNGKLDIYLMNADGSNKHWALPTAPAYPITAPSFSPDGKSLLVMVWLTSSTSKPTVGKIDLAAGTWTLVAPASYFGGLQGWYPTYDKDGAW